MNKDRLVMPGHVGLQTGTVNFLGCVFAAKGSGYFVFRKYIAPCATEKMVRAPYRGHVSEVRRNRLSMKLGGKAPLNGIRRSTVAERKIPRGSAA